jgi:chloride channel 7
MDSLTANEAAMGIHFLVWFSYIVGCSLVAMTFVFFSPASAAEGSGVAHVKALLHHWVFTPELFSLKTYLIKLVGLSFSVGCGLWLGKVDVHISVILTVLLLKLPLFKNINESEEDRYQMLVCGSCVGLSVNFGVPVSAVLFGLELCGSYYRSRIYMKAIFVSTFSAFFARWLSATLAGKDHLTVWLNVKIASPGWKYNEIPAFLILGALCGLLGTLFVVWNEQMIKIKKLVGTKKIIFLELFVTLSAFALSRIAEFFRFHSKS